MSRNPICSRVKYNVVTYEVIIEYLPASQLINEANQRVHQSLSAASHPTAQIRPEPGIYLRSLGRHPLLLYCRIRPIFLLIQAVAPLHVSSEIAAVSRGTPSPRRPSSPRGDASDYGSLKRRRLGAQRRAQRSAASTYQTLSTAQQRLLGCRLCRAFSAVTSVAMTNAEYVTRQEGRCLRNPRRGKLGATRLQRASLQWRSGPRDRSGVRS
ncbi:hypothetical protein OBBRIDRAFT_159856 [Obba rivulosa]|uniref:Uncharacterized protein n=1 Tax=Obba rivulosa TaxID=1052685 RepID=A0A8E2AMH9_9APHY|nr:hypothetical protein OBBRIDRAFT_159856 [Obba rivulosa]